MSTILELREVSKHYATQRVVSNVSLSVERGALFSLLGPSGCGKTTTLRMVAGFDQPTAGDILLDGAPITRLRPYERNVSTVFQNYALFPHLTVQANIEFGLRHKGQRDNRQRVGEVLELVRLTGKEKRYPSQLSGGERQRVALARSLALRPDVLLLDEPLAALDPILRKQVRRELHHLQRSTGITFLLVTHDQEEALTLSDGIAVMHSGRIEQIGSPRDIYLRPRTRFIAEFLGAMNWIGGVGVRPEVTRIGRMAPGNGERTVTATVQASRFLGNCVHVESRVSSTGEDVVCEAPCSHESFPAGETVHVWWNPADEMRFPDI